MAKKRVKLKKLKWEQITSEEVWLQLMPTKFYELFYMIDFTFSHEDTDVELMHTTCVYEHHIKPHLSRKILNYKVEIEE